ncbi:Tfp pilus assembly protein PilX [Terrimicrobium sacchariphilum]|uniref:Tfp pilus assembly protein PilX n=1 Tax=Terrimicrobium sacchariphilum TaxID=690879 RepID=A0A146GCZ2_TERSA|nr:hypothetical protein [Terrimicrobium sacchariphilum]GAT35425.1 Tfp pilus assembly protein PilX [Terrimicrobium sacchariphilum]
MTYPRSRFAARRGGMALVIVLAFVVLLSGLVLAYISHSMLTRKMSDSSLGDTRARQLAESSLEVIVSDLKQEIANGSTTNTYGTNIVYLPSSNAYIVPMRSGNPTVSGTNDPIPNLIRRSVRSDVIASPGVPSRASAVNSATDPSRNGRFISPARWNKHYLIPRSDKGNSVDTTPNVSANFTAPDWVYVTTNGPAVLNAPNTSVIGRYAYAIYDEGGLLDANVAGYPSASEVRKTAASGAATGVWGTGNKGGSAAADLTVLGLKQQEIDQIVGWRTFASSRPSGALPGLTFDEGAAKRYYDLWKAHPYAFLKVPRVSASSTDQVFTSRQSLLEFRKLVGFSQDALQYLGTFSRDLEQPAFIPNPNRPKVQANWNNNSTYGTGNDAFGADRDTTPESDINPPFPQVRVTKSFTRRDGTMAVVGEPLVKKRFALSRLGEILRTATASKSDSDSIYRDFGIYRGAATEPWQYGHGDDSGILRLDKVAAQGREPDFFELLKAAINVGSLGKSAAQPGWNQTGTYSELQHSGRDIYTNLQILQIGANIIDQADNDGYPTRIAFAGDSTKEVRGVESLPYLYRLRVRYAPQTDMPAAGGAPASYPASMLVNPEVWNPHATDAPSDAPTDFRIHATSALGAGVPTSSTLAYKDGTTTVVPIDWDSAGNLTFRTGGSLYREPTVLVKPGIPSGSGLSGPSRADALSGLNLTGLVAFDFQRKKGASDVDKGFLGLPDSGPVIIYLEYKDGASYRIYDQMIVQWSGATFSPKEESTATYPNPPKSWVNYPSKLVKVEFERNDPRTSRWGVSAWDLLGLMAPTDPTNMIFPSNWAGLDQPPRGPKTGVPSDKGFVNVFGSGVAPSNYNNNDLYPNNDSSFRGFKQGYWTMNTVRDQRGFYGVSDQAFYNRDPDGIVRRAMGGYSSDTASGGSTSTSQGLPMITGNKASRPVILNRPFRSVAELGYTFRDTPWKNLDFSFPESGDAALLDVFCVDEVNNDSSLIAGKVNLNTRQMPVLKALLAGSIVDELSSTPTVLGEAVAESIASKLIERTTSKDTDKGPLAARGELVGRWKGTGASPATSPNKDPDALYSGFSLDVGTVSGMKGTDAAFITAQREAAVRALADSGTTRVWNLLIDVVAQAGRFAPGQSSLSGFYVEGEKRYWLHIAIDRFTGKVLDKQLEVVTE